MATKRNNTLTEGDKEARVQTYMQALELVRRGKEEGHERQALTELREWYEKWVHTYTAGVIRDFILKEDGQRRARGSAFDWMAVVITVVLLEKIGATEPAAKKQAAERFCTSLRNVQLYTAQYGAAVRQMVDITVTDFRGAGWEHNPSFGLRLTQEEIRKLNEITFREK
jgi:hypothetical protein